MRNKYTGTLCSKVWEIQNIIKTKKWGFRGEDIREIEQLLGYIHQDKQAMYEKMRELKVDPERYKELEQEAFNLLTPTQQKSEAMRFHRDSKIREIIMGMIE